MPGAPRSWVWLPRSYPTRMSWRERPKRLEKLAAKPAAALQASKRLMKQPFREQIKAAMKAENEEFSAQVRSEDAKEALHGLPGKRKPDFTRNIKSPAAA